MHLLNEVLELDVARVDERDLEAVQIEVGAAVARQRAGGAVVVGMDVRHDQPADPSRADVSNSGPNRAHRLVGVHAAVEQVNLVAVREQEDVDQAIFEWDGQAQLENSRGDLAQARLEHSRHCRRRG